MDKQNDSGCAVILGAGAREGVGAAVSVLAAKNGLHVFIVGRTREKLDKLVEEIRADGGQATAVVADCTDPDDVDGVFKQLAEHGQPLRFAVHNMAAPNMPTEFLKTDIEFFETHWRRATFGGFLAGQAVVRQMMKQKGDHRGTLIFTGASGSLRGKAKFSAFASAKAGLRAMAQSIAREFGPQGIHVAYFMIDAAINTPRTRPIMGADKPDEYFAEPFAIADEMFRVAHQHRSTWSFLVDLRPFGEVW